MNLTILIKIKQGFSDNFNFEECKNNDENAEQELTLQERIKLKFEKQFIENIKKEEEKNFDFEKIKNVFSQNEIEITKLIQRKFNIEKDDLLGWDL